MLLKAFKEESDYLGAKEDVIDNTVTAALTTWSVLYDCNRFDTVYSLNNTGFGLKHVWKCSSLDFFFLSFDVVVNLRYFVLCCIKFQSFRFKKNKYKDEKNGKWFIIC